MIPRPRSHAARVLGGVLVALLIAGAGVGAYHGRVAVARREDARALEGSFARALGDPLDLARFRPGKVTLPAAPPEHFTAAVLPGRWSVLLRGSWAWLEWPGEPAGVVVLATFDRRAKERGVQAVSVHTGRVLWRRVVDAHVDGRCVAIERLGNDILVRTDAVAEDSQAASPPLVLASRTGAPVAGLALPASLAAPRCSDRWYEGSRDETLLATEGFGPELLVGGLPAPQGAPPAWRWPVSDWAGRASARSWPFADLALGVVVFHEPGTLACDRGVGRVQLRDLGSGLMHWERALPDTVQRSIVSECAAVDGVDVVGPYLRLTLDGDLNSRVLLLDLATGAPRLLLVGSTS